MYGRNQYDLDANGNNLLVLKSSFNINWSYFREVYKNNARLYLFYCFK